MPHSHAIKTVHWALGGGGPRGAHQAAELCAALDDPSLRIGHISGTSAGAVNALLLASAFAKFPDDAVRARAEAKRRLTDFWLQLSEERYWQDVMPDIAGAQATVLDAAARNPAELWSPGFWFGVVQKQVSFRNPLIVMLRRFVSEDEIRVLNAPPPGVPRLLIDVSDMERREQVLFGPPNISIECVAASGGIPGITGEVVLNMPGGGQRRCGDGAFHGSNPPIAALHDAVLAEHARAHPGTTPPQVTIITSILNALEPYDLVREATEGRVTSPLDFSLWAHAWWQHKMNATALRELEDVQQRPRTDLHVIAHEELDTGLHERMRLSPGKVRAALTDAGWRQWHGFMRAHGRDLGTRSSFDTDVAQRRWRVQPKKPLAAADAA